MSVAPVCSQFIFRASHSALVPVKVIVLILASENAYSSILVTVEGIVIFCNEVQLLNAPNLISVVPLLSVTDSRFSQSLNNPIPITDTVPGTSTFLIPLFSNALEPILVTVLGIGIDSKLEQP